MTSIFFRGVSKKVAIIIISAIPRHEEPIFKHVSGN